jgi:hypothetical protein
MRTTILLGLTLFLGFAVVFAPAGLTRIVFDQIDTAALTGPTGTIWHGQGQILLQERPLGKLGWTIRPGSLLQGALSYDLVLTGSKTSGAAPVELTGSVDVQFNGTLTMDLSGQVAAEFINRYLATYDMTISGDLTLTNAQLSLADGLPTGADGQVNWSGGSVAYILSGRARASILPPLVAYLGKGATATVFAQGGQTPLIRAELLNNGFAKVGITKLLTKLLDNPWPGSDPDHEIVLEVEEQVF